MSARTQLEQIARDWIALWNAPVDWKRFDELHAEDFEDCSAAGRPSDRRGFASGLAEILAAFPDLRTEISDLVVDEAAGKIAVRWRAEGSNRQRYLGIGPTYRLTIITGIEIIAVEWGRIVRRWGEWDISGHHQD